jgi:signal transduction histidine kinase
MLYLLIALSAISLLCQVIVAALALRLIRITGARGAWLCVAAALFLVALCPTVELVRLWHFDPNELDAKDFWLCGVEIAVAGLLLVGFAGIAPVFRSAVALREAMQFDREELEQLVQLRTADLLSMNAELAEQIESRKKAQAAQREEQRHLEHLLEMYERDRQLVSYEIHDGFVQHATGALMSFQAALSQLQEDASLAHQSMAQGVQMLQDGIAEARWLISGLRPTILDDFGVIATVDHLVRESQVRTDTKIQWTHDVQFDRLAPPLELALFRVIQESLTNALRHGKSNRVSIDLRQHGDVIYLVVQDWGTGFDRENVKAGRFGLRGIEERARVLGGKADIQSKLGEGTRVMVEFPVVRLEAAAEDDTRSEGAETND